MKKFFLMICTVFIVIQTGNTCGGPGFSSYILYGQSGGILDPRRDHYIEDKGNFDTVEKLLNSEQQWITTADLDTADLRASIIASVSDPTCCENIITQYTSLRASIKSGTSSQFMIKTGDKDEVDFSTYAAILPDIPQEFVLYLKGAVAYHVQSFNEAKTQWTHLLSLPPEQRKYRSTWAAFMLGKTCLVTDVTSAPTYFIQTRELAKLGFVDSLNLSWDSLGWQGMAEMKTDHFKEALQCYLQQSKENPDSQEAKNSLTECCRATYFYHQIDPQIMKDPEMRKLLLKFSKTRDQCYAPCRFFDAIQKAGVQIDKEDADYLVWISYSGGDYRLSWEWIKTAKELGPNGKWIQSKLFLREGKIKEGLDILREIASSFPPEDQPMLYSEAGLLHLGRKEYIEAMDTFLRGNGWNDAAYIAERVLTIEELSNYIKTMNEDSYKEKLQNLLARRYARAKQWKNAAQINHYYQVYSSYVKNAEDKKLTNEERAESYYSAGKVQRASGMELFGTEVDPDCAAVEGRTFRPITGDRFKRML